MLQYINPTGQEDTEMYIVDTDFVNLAHNWIYITICVSKNDTYEN